MAFFEGWGSESERKRMREREGRKEKERMREGGRVGERMRERMICISKTVAFRERTVGRASHNRL